MSSSPDEVQVTMIVTGLGFDYKKEDETLTTVANEPISEQKLIREEIKQSNIVPIKRNMIVNHRQSIPGLLNKGDLEKIWLIPAIKRRMP